MNENSKKEPVVSGEAALPKAKKIGKKPGSGKGIITRRKMAHGSVSIAIAAVFVALMVLVNMGVSYLTERFYLKADITPTNIYEISDVTKILLENLDMDIRVHVLLAEDTVINSKTHSIANEFLKRFRTLSGGRISINYVDIFKNPNFINNYQDTNDAISSGSFIIESDVRYKVLKLADLYRLTTNLNPTTYETTQYISGIDADQTLASAIQYVTAVDLPTVVFLTGHNEEYGGMFKSFFTNSNYGYQEVNLLFDEIPKDAAIVVMGMPSSDYLPMEVDKLEAYMTKTSGNMIAFTGVSPVETPNLDEWFAEWGVGLKNQMVLDGSNSLVYPYNVITSITDKGIVPNMTVDSSTYILTPNARVIEPLWDTNAHRYTKVFLRTADTAYAKEYSANTSFDTYDYTDGDAAGPFAAGIVVKHGETSASGSILSELVVLSSLYMSADSIYDMSSLANKAFTTDLIDYLNPVTNVLNIESREYYSNNIVILTSQVRVVFWTLIVIIPAVVLALGLFVWIRRKHK